MKKTLMILGALFVCLILAGVIGLYLLFVKGGALDKESKAYVDDVTPKILANLSKETLFLYASDELKRTATPEDFDKIFKLFAKLGQFKQYRGSKGQAHISLTTKYGKRITGTYEADAEFENGPATVLVTIIKHETKWQILGFRINSEVFIN